jgi:hypothetical protein
MSWLSRKGRRGRDAHREGDVLVADPRFDEWEVVRDFEDLSTARAWR